VLQSRIAEAITMFGTIVTDQMGVQSMQINEIELLNDSNNSGIAGGEDNGNDASSVDTTVLIGALATGLGVFLLTLIWVVASQRQQHLLALTHARLEDELEDSRSFHPQLISSDSGVYEEEDGASHHYETTVISIKDYRDESARSLQPNVSLGNRPSIPDEFNILPFDEAEDIFWTNHPRDRYHQCSAATCEVCERRRQQGILHGGTTPGRVQLLSPPSPERVPSYPERLFVSRDTVQL
jgi:hypothetical protein